VRALLQRASDSDRLDRYAKIATIVTQSERADIEDGIRWIRDLCITLEIPRLRAYAIQEKEVPLLVELAEKASSMKANPIVLSREELTESLTRAI